MLLDDDVMTDGEAEAGAFSGWLGCEEGIEHLFPDLGWNASAIVADRNLYLIAEWFLVAALTVGSKPLPLGWPFRFVAA